MLLALLALFQTPVAPPPPAKPAAPPKLIERVVVTPANAEVGVGQTLQLAAKAYDANGNVLPDATFRWFTGGEEGTVSETGLVKAGYRGKVKVTVAASMAGSKPAFGDAEVKILPSPPSRIVVEPAITRLVVGTRLSITGTPYSAENDRRYDAVTFSSSNAKVAQVSPDGRIVAVAPGSATITAKAAGAAQAIPVTVIAGPVSKVVITPENSTVLTGDVVHFKADVHGAGGKSLGDVAVRWTLEAGGPEASASIDDNGSFVAESPGKYTITASVGGATADAVIEAGKRKVGRGFQVVGRVPVKFSTAEAWVHPSNTCVYLSTIADRVYAIDITTPATPKIVDSMMTNARIVNDVMTTEDGKFGAFSREGASDRKNGIVIFDASDPCHPKPIAEYTETVQGGVHSSYVYQGHVYLTDDATGSMRVIDITDPYKPHEVARFQMEQTEEGRYLHDIMVVDGLAYLSYWNDGLVIVDVGNGMKGGSPEKPVLVSQAKYDLQELYTRVEQPGASGHAAPTRPGATRTTSSSATRSTRRRPPPASRTATTSRSAGCRCSMSRTSWRRSWWPGTSPPMVACTTSGWLATRSTWATTRGRPRRRHLGRAQGRPAQAGPRDQLDPHGGCRGQPATRHVRVGRRGEERLHLRARHQLGPLDPQARAEGGGRDALT